MSIQTFLTVNFSDLKAVIGDLCKTNEEFSSHDIIEKFTNLHEYEYIVWLDSYKKQHEKGAFKTVHSQIARFVSEHSDDLGIKKTPRKGSEHVFGDTDVIQWWEAINGRKLITSNNIFSLATKELTQDAFFTWLIKWADDTFITLDMSLKNTAKRFVQMLLNKGGVKINTIKTVETWLQWEKIDISVLINNQYFVIIEDKTSTGTNVETLNRYKTTAKEWADSKNHQTVCLYVKTGNESQVSLNDNVLPAGFNVVNRQDIISILNLYNGTNKIIVQYRDYITDIECQTNSFETKPLKEWDYLQWQGLYLKLEQQIADLDWWYVSNPSGGFQCAYWHGVPYNETKSNSLYLQIEETKFCFKIGLDGCSDAYNTGYHWSEIIIENANGAGYNEVVRPSRMRVGNTMTIATVDMNYFNDSTGLLEFDRFMTQIKNYENILNEVVK